ncbi:hypothetical protein MTO96_019909 [Rhipicephalus appendiculatus]
MAEGQRQFAPQRAGYQANVGIYPAPPGQSSPIPMRKSESALSLSVSQPLLSQLQQRRGTICTSELIRVESNDALPSMPGCGPPPMGGTARATLLHAPPRSPNPPAPSPIRAITDVVPDTVDRAVLPPCYLPKGGARRAVVGLRRRQVPSTRRSRSRKEAAGPVKSTMSGSGSRLRILRIERDVDESDSALPGAPLHDCGPW